MVGHGWCRGTGRHDVCSQNKNNFIIFIGHHYLFIINIVYYLVIFILMIFFLAYFVF